MKIHQKIGLVGVGNMGTAILTGLFEKHIATPEQVWVYDKLSEKSEKFSKQEWPVHVARDAADLAENTEAVLLAVKPQDLKEIAESLSAAMGSGKVLISILAGTPLEKIKEIFKADCGYVRAMPNLGAKVGKAITAIAGANEEEVKVAEKIFSGCGTTVRLHERFFDAVTALSGSGPAYFFFLMEALVSKAMHEGIPEKEAQLLAVQTALGASLLAETATETPAELRKMVTSKGGTTEAALKTLFDHKFSETFDQALQAAIDRGRELSQA